MPDCVCRPSALLAWLLIAVVASNVSLVSCASPWSFLSRSNLPNKTRSIKGRRRFPMTLAQQEKELKRLAKLSPHKRAQERAVLEKSIVQLSNVQQGLQWNIGQLEHLRDLNTGALHTWSGRYKAMKRDYGPVPIVAWYGTLWVASAVVCYGTFSWFQWDTKALVQSLDARMGWNLSRKIKPAMGQLGMALLANELLEPIRLPVALLTFQPTMEMFRRRQENVAENSSILW